MLSLCSSLRQGVVNLALNSGLGALTPETVVLPLHIPSAPENGVLNFATNSSEDFAFAVHDLLKLRRNVLVAANFDGPVTHELRGARADQTVPHIDVWTFGRLPSADDPRFMDSNAALALASQFGLLARSAMCTITRCPANVDPQTSDRSSQWCFRAVACQCKLTHSQRKHILTLGATQRDADAKYCSPHFVLGTLVRCGYSNGPLGLQ